MSYNITRSPDYPVPERLNIGLTIFVFVGAVLLLKLASAYTNSWIFWPLAISFAYLMQTNYALLHEGTHDNLHTKPRWNYLLGFMTGLLFPVPFSLAHTTHQGHHLRNRTDYEMFDMYYPEGSRLVRTIQWYGTLCGTFYPVAILGTILLTLFPWILKTAPFRAAASTSYIVNDIVRSREIKAARIETLLIVAFWGALFSALKLDPAAVLIMYTLYGINWSTRQYIGHAYTKRHVIEGALNLKHNRFMCAVLLNGNYDLNHHRHPDVSWNHLAKLTPTDIPMTNYYRQYLSMWTRGPILAKERGPEALEVLPLSIHKQTDLQPSGAVLQV